MHNSKKMYSSWDYTSIHPIMLGKELVCLTKFVFILIFISGCSPVHKLDGRMVYIGPGATMKPGSDSVEVECPRWTYNRGAEWLVSDGEYRIEACVMKVDGKRVSRHTAFEPQPELLYLQPDSHDLLINFRLQKKHLRVHPYATYATDDSYFYATFGMNIEGEYCMLTFNGLPKHRYIIKGSTPVTVTEARYSTTMAHGIWLEDCATKERVASFSHKILIPRE